MPLDDQLIVDADNTTTRSPRTPIANAKESARSQEEKRAGALAEYFSALFDESFCSHNFKLVGSRIFSSGRFQEEEAANARDSELSFARAGSSNSSLNGSLGSSGSSSEVLPRVGSSGQMSDGEPWGWFDEIEDPAGGEGGGPAPDAPPVTKATPPYILTESLSTQRLWRETAGKRPRQPSEERQFFEEQWAKNFSDSEVDYSEPLAETDAAAARKRAKKRTAPHSKVHYRATSPFGSAVSKSFQCDNCGQITSIMVHIPKFQIIQTGSDVHAEYLIVVGLGTVTLGVWRRFSEFQRLASKLSRSRRRDQFHNALCSWRCLRERQRWFRCLDVDYLILKTFLLERFLHDFVFESMSPNTVREFLGVL
ncbi:conserved unknown protein [Ectocarpus siliculosus]|uniref:PX domain-containing protein n=1 Tax=Ectocarpus siliculosus TaxID=2880 RepID=D7G182_ECTSI|nr:conserved unknown protein [Ectocarpus siliculosus]|eukprot:CBJ33192.1 conserved unknown protein [Ectocarpus siliculosus]